MKVKDSVNYLAVILLCSNALLIELGVFSTTIEKLALRMVALLLLLTNFLFTEIKFPFFLTLLCLVLPVQSLLTGNPDILSIIYPLVIGICWRNYGPPLVIRYCLVGSASVLVLLLIANLTGFTTYEISEFRNRHSFGLNGLGKATLFFNMWFSFVTLWITYSIYSSRGRLLSILVSVAATWLIYVLTDVRGGTISFAVFILSVAMLFTIPVIVQALASICVLGPVLFLLLAFLTAIFLDNDYGNELLSDRPSLYARFITNVEWQVLLFGGSVKEHDLVAIVDNSYLHLFFGMGFGFFVIFIVWCYRLMRWMWISENNYVTPLIVSSFVYFMPESLLFRIENGFIIFFWYLLVRAGTTAREDWHRERGLVS